MLLLDLGNEKGQLVSKVEKRQEEMSRRGRIW